MHDEGWTEIGPPGQAQLAAIAGRIDSLDCRLTRIEAQLKEILGHCRQQSIIQRASLPFTRHEDPDVSAARQANLALRQRVPISLHKAKTSNAS